MMTARDFANRLSDLLRRERGAMADFLVALAEFDAARLWIDLEYKSLFYFLHRELGLSKGAAYYRKVGVDLIRQFPEVVEPLRDGRLCITSLVELARVLTPENRAEVLPRFFHLSRREAQAVAVEVNPVEAAPRRAVVTSLPPPSRQPAPSLSLLAVPAPPSAELVQLAEPAPKRAQPMDFPTVARSAEVRPLTAELRRLHITVPQRFLDKLDAAKEGMSHAQPDADSAEVLEEALDLLLERQARRRGQVANPLAKPRPSKSDHIPARVKRAVWARDSGCCQWAMASGGICGSRRRIEYDHVRPRGQGGPPTVENVRLLCHFHNQLAARRVYGDDWMDRFTGPRAREPVAVYGTGRLRARWRDEVSSRLMVTAAS